MGLGVLEDRWLERVPGAFLRLHSTTFFTTFFTTANTAVRTVLLDEDAQRRDSLPQDPSLKYDRSGPHPILLVPQPSDDPNDPLNWPLWRRDVILFVLSLLSVIASTLSPLLAANTLTLSFEFQRNFTDMALLTGYHLLGVGIAGFLFVPSARIWGKRHAFLLGTIILIISSAWGGATGKNYASLLWARIFQGVGLAPFEALVNACVGDLYFVHERGKRMALSNLALFGGAFFTPVIVGKMTDSIGWEWTFYFVAIFAGLLLPALFFFCPETAFRRDDRLNLDMGDYHGGQRREGSFEDRHGHELAEAKMDEDGVNRGSHQNSQDGSGDFKPQGDVETQGLHVRPAPPQKDSFAKTLLPFNGRKTDESFWKLALRPFPLFLQPGILWSCLIQGTLIGWTVMIGVVLAAVMLGPPLFFTEVETGYMYTGAFVGALIGFVLAGLLSDSVPALMTRWNNGVYEPEFRMVLVIPQLVLGCAGLYGFGIVSDNIPKYHWFWPDFFFALEVAGMVLGAVASALYIVDAHREVAVEAFTCLLVFKNIFSFGLTWKGYDWIVDGGVKEVFVAVGSVQVGVCMLTVLMYVFGKWNRSFFARYDLLRLLHLW
ncbi:putative mfs transporter protein [Neofusicoccum parvum UCRNP2]|uniref:Putative mfs transporter protein n=1 Tax=Botryosphaeria parva (strain UCR-NP2) TaxID=1287680 RepID=R1EJ69_BOTPV|nr:putative mfs transporter protein [Neofusicoccum parvum UCRNP2]